MPAVALPEDVRDRIARLSVGAFGLVEGSLAGLHKSPYQGFSVEFAQHREYTWGDELRHVDWKVFARTDRHYVKQYEEETNLQATIVLDQSESMLYRGSRAQASKYEYAATLAAGLAFVLLRQQDAAGLVLFDDQVRRRLPPSAHPAQLRNMTAAMSEVELRAETTAGPVLHQLADELTRRGVVILISDLLFARDQLLDGLKHLRHKRHDVVVLQVVDPDELTFPFEDMTRFEGLEVPRALLVDPRALRQGYLEALNEFLREVEAACTEARADHVRMDTSAPVGVALARFLSHRLRRRGRG
ncbi:MAG: DUF58 domain-containing protein [Planctomycetes bacterium]|nr:DUF58 domain-containing protein [Planctomycetota bacterium]